MVWEHGHGGHHGRMVLVIHDFGKFRFGNLTVVVGVNIVPALVPLFSSCISMSFWSKLVDALVHFVLGDSSISIFVASSENHVNVFSG